MGIKETFSDLFGKGKDLASGVAQQAGDFASTAGLKAKMLDKNLEYDGLMKKLGTAVYDTVKDDPAIVAANSELFDKIADNVAVKQELADEIASIEAAADARRTVDAEPVAPERAAQPDYSTGYRTATVGATQE